MCSDDNFSFNYWNLSLLLKERKKTFSVFIENLQEKANKASLTLVSANVSFYRANLDSLYQIV